MPLIRPAETRDLTAITEIYADAVVNSKATWDEVAPDLQSMTAVYAARTAAGFPYFVAEATEGRIIGYVGGSAFHPQTGWRYAIEDSIYVAKGAQRQGIGRSLLEALIEEATARGFRQMIAGISMPGGERSVAFHEALGFRMVGEFKDAGWKQGEWLTAVYMQRALGEGAASAPLPPPDRAAPKN
ncbi:MAG: GNAT family N-acetyltransferase [Alphaproteobacteria bacterium]|nr:GNAT family N-acetyltransferase [Alphaproteobacteria bacterium]